MPEKINSKDAKQLMEQEFGIFTEVTTFRGWLRKWAKKYPDMIFQPIPRGQYIIDKKKFREFLNGQKKTGQ